MGALWDHLAALLAQLSAQLHGALSGIQLHRVGIVRARLRSEFRTCTSTIFYVYQCRHAIYLSIPLRSFLALALSDFNCRGRMPYILDKKLLPVTGKVRTHELAILLANHVFTTPQKVLW